MTMTTGNCGALIDNKKKAGLLKNTSSRIGRVLKQNKIKDSDNSTHQRKLVPTTAKPATDQLTS